MQFLGFLFRKVVQMH